MSRRDKLIEKMKNSPGNIDWSWRPFNNGTASKSQAF